MQERERFSSRIGFIFIAAGCAIGLGNVWRFPYMVGQYGGALFVLFYLLFVVILGAPIILMELSVGRASQRSAAAAFKNLEKEGQKWHWFRLIALSGNYLLMMFYTTICGLTLHYFIKYCRGDFDQVSSPQEIATIYHQTTENPYSMIFWMALVVVLGFLICGFGLKKGIEPLTKWMMVSLFILLFILVIQAFTLPGLKEGLSFYLIPKRETIKQIGIPNILFAAMGQSFFALGIGIGSLGIFGSYMDKKRSLLGETFWIVGLDALVSILAGLVIFPACFSFGIQPDSGPNLIFITLPNVFTQMPGGRIWGSLFFLFLGFAALSSIIAVFENIIAMDKELFHISRKTAVFLNIGLMTLLSLPAALSFNLLSFWHPMDPGSTLLNLEDFILSNHILPLGCLVYLFFCTCKFGWGWNAFLSEVNAGKGLKLPSKVKPYICYILPFLILLIFLQELLK